jgi:protein transport protein SEC13
MSSCIRQQQEYIWRRSHHTEHRSHAGDVQVLVWSEKSAGSWEQKVLHDFQAPVWRVSWSITGSILAVTDSSNAVTLWKETLDGKWQQLQQ